MRDLARRRVEQDLKHADLRVRLFSEAGLHAGTHQNEELPEESQALLRASDEVRLELDKEAFEWRVANGLRP